MTMALEPVFAHQATTTTAPAALKENPVLRAALVRSMGPANAMLASPTTAAIVPGAPREPFGPVHPANASMSVARTQCMIKQPQPVPASVVTVS